MKSDTSHFGKGHLLNAVNVGQTVFACSTWYDTIMSQMLRLKYGNSTPEKSMDQSSLFETEKECSNYWNILVAIQTCKN